MISVEQLAFLTFAMVLMVAVISPGPAIAALVSRIMARGTDGIAAFCAGLVLGDLIWLSCAMFGLAALAALFQPVFLIVKYVGAAYLLFLAWKLWRDSGAPVKAEPLRGQGRQLFGAAMLISLGNPKIMLFYLALMPTVIDLTRLTIIDMAELAIIVAVVVSAVLAGYVILAAQARRMFTSPRAIQSVNRIAGLAMAGAAAAIVVRN
ncbi:LysE family translocator [Pseudorhodoplanes sp.]|uniref:LysE family translocator n=1 Tax=Pseudorhodoplanes sp. TaxID=1934341 RepID=UPI002D7FC33E|nr:LysE family translocator [Pseudorhodoplanes sp.]